MKVCTKKNQDTMKVLEVIGFANKWKNHILAKYIDIYLGTISKFFYLCYICTDKTQNIGIALSRKDKKKYDILAS